MNFDYTYLLFVAPALIIGTIAQILVKSRFAKYSKVSAKKPVTGLQAAAYLLKVNNIQDVKLAHISGKLTDNYNPTNKTLNLSDSTIQSNSIAAIGVAAHETGHAIQHNTKYGPLAFRRSLVPVANLGTHLGPVMVILGIILANTVSLIKDNPQYFGICQLVTNIGILLYSGAVLFHLITLPVEFNASSRALKILKKTGVLDQQELKCVRKVLNAAAMTYVASAMSALGSLLRFLFLSRSTRKR